MKYYTALENYEFVERLFVLLEEIHICRRLPLVPDTLLSENCLCEGCSSLR
jgi:hypothetical protein